ncbi:hypothetical protein Tco_0699867 [Tanacetum coccineum]
MEKVGSVAYKLEFPQELSKVHNTFHISNLKKCYSDKPLAVPLDGLHFDDKLQFVEEPVEITDREVKRLKRSRIPLVKVRWNSKRGPEFTWEREDQFRKKYPHLFTKTASSSILLDAPWYRMAASVEAWISLIKLEFSSCLFADSLMNLLSVSSIDRLRLGTKDSYCSFDRIPELFLYIPLLEKVHQIACSKLLQGFSLLLVGNL